MNQPRSRPVPVLGKNQEEEKDKNLAGDSAPAGDVHPSRPAREASPKKPTDPNVRLVIDTYHSAFRDRFGTPPPIPGEKYGAIAKRLLAGRSTEEAVWIVTEFFNRTPAFYEERRLFGLEHVLAAAPTLLARRAEEGR